MQLVPFAMSSALSSYLQNHISVCIRKYLSALLNQNSSPHIFRIMQDYGQLYHRGETVFYKDLHSSCFSHVLCEKGSLAFWCMTAPIPSSFELIWMEVGAASSPRMHGVWATLLGKACSCQRVQLHQKPRMEEDPLSCC